MVVSGDTPNKNPFDPAASGTTGQAYGNALLYVPVHTSTAASSTTPAVFSYLQSGNAAGSGTSTAPDRRFVLASGARAYAVTTEAESPEYQPGLLSGLPDEKIMVGSPREGSTDKSVAQLRCVLATRGTPSPRTTYVITGASTGLYHPSGGAIPTPTSSVTIASTGHLSFAVLESRIYGTDGETYFWIDPRASDGFVRFLKPNASGAYPKKCRLFGAWNHRLLMGRGVDPHLVLMCATGDPTDANTLPAVQTGYEAATVVLDSPLTTFIPFSDDLLIMGTASSVFRMTGDPAQGGRLDRIADLYGMPLGEPWCKDDNGNTYFFMSHGGVSRMSASGRMESISDKHMKRRLESIDLTTNTVRLVWNDGARGLHLFVCPLSFSGTAPTTHYFWENETGAWYEDSLPYVVTCARSVDIDGTGNRAVWIGCQDGYIRRFTNTVSTDDGSPIYSKVFIGWLSPDDKRMQSRFARPQVALASDLGGCRLGFYTSDDANAIGSVVAESELSPGQSETLPMVARGNHVGIKLYGTGRWAYENGTVNVSPLGIRRKLS